MTKEDKTNRPSIGVATVVIKNDQILMGKDTRKGDVYGVPGGHWENGESLKECAVREVCEESGATCDSVQLISVYDFYREDKQKNYVTIGMKAAYVSGKLTDLYDEGRLDWAWYNIEDALKLNLFPADRILIERYLSGVVFE
ncbi:MAG: NUDIX domain-containing protein [Candidatus Pacebacteria bacterium]|nr:NUDIX domain-containing protein [Candidatus Paceibacterota bacterium]